MKFTYLSWFMLIVAISMLSCSDNIVSECIECADEPTGQIVTFTDIQQSVFNVSCLDCHSGTTPAGGLDLSSDVSYANLVNMRSNGSDLNRVEPFNSSASYLVRVLEGNNAPQMPPSGRLSQAKIDSIIVWIDRGALNSEEP